MGLFSQRTVAGATSVKHEQKSFVTVGFAEAGKTSLMTARYETGRSCVGAWENRYQRQQYMFGHMYVLWLRNQDVKAPDAQR